MKFQSLLAWLVAIDICVVSQSALNELDVLVAHIHFYVPNLASPGRLAKQLRSYEAPLLVGFVVMALDFIAKLIGYLALIIAVQ